MRKTSKHRAFFRRNNAIRKLGFKSYKEYLDSDLWRKIRLKVLSRDEFVCQYCGKDGTQVHHEVYKMKYLNGDSISRLKTICEKCHQTISKLNQIDENFTPLRATQYFLINH